jgi:spore coat polysaccharide biosynthesis protein SpsF|tara:strand:+ start:1669 stop:2685 length:1017 start_codon:yes stop_codon:yes gene_type:complete
LELNKKLYLICNAKRSVGFGHLSRCLCIAKQLRNTFKIYFAGDFSEDAISIIRENSFPILRYDLLTGKDGIAIIDLMFDEENANFYDKERIGFISQHFKKTILLSSADTVPGDLPVDIVVGYLLKPSENGNYSFKSFPGLEYAPIPIDFTDRRLERREIRDRINRVFICFGGWKNIDGPLLVLDTLREINFSGMVDVLLSPLQSEYQDMLKAYGSTFRTRIHCNVPSIAPLLNEADLAIGTYGHIVFESLCLGTPFIVIGVKDFQVSYAKNLEKEGFLVCGGKLGKINRHDIHDAILSMDREQRQQLSNKGRHHIDTNGIIRITNIIREETQIEPRGR